MLLFEYNVFYNPAKTLLLCWLFDITCNKLVIHNKSVSLHTVVTVAMTTIRSS